MAKQPRSKARSSGKNTEKKSLDHLLISEEIDVLQRWGFAAVARRERPGALVVTLLGTAGRRFEVGALRCENVFMGPGGPQVFFPETKGGGSATVPITDNTYQALAQWKLGRPNDAPLIPTEKGDFMHPATLWRVFKDALRQAGVARNVGVHATRHAAGFLLLRATGDLTKVQTFLRHKSLSTTANWYKHVHMPDLREGLRKAGL